MDEIWVFILVGFLAQLIDGCLGMAYGVSCNTFLLSIGVPPAIASASVHTAEVITTAVSGVSHIGFGNVDWKLVEKLAIPGVIGGIIGAYILTEMPEDTIKPIVALYLMMMGLRILSKAFRTIPRREVRSHLIPLGFAGGFLDAIGGGGWGPVVTTTLVVRGNHPRFAIGSVNFAEFFVTLGQSIVFFLLLGELEVEMVTGLIAGGVIAAPMAAYLTKRISAQKLMVLVGIVIIILSLRTIYLALQG